MTGDVSMSCIRYTKCSIDAVKVPHESRNHYGCLMMFGLYLNFYCMVNCRDYCDCEADLLRSIHQL